MFKQKIYVIATKNYKTKKDFDFIAEFKTQRCDKPPMVNYKPLRNAIHFYEEKKAKEVLEKQPKWIKEGHIILPCTRTFMFYKIENQ